MRTLGLTLLISISILLLGLTQSGQFRGPQRGPVPASQKVAHSSHCAGCHGFDETGQALVDAQGHDVNIYDDWQISMMGLSARDPFWRATMTHEVTQYPAAQEAIEGTCLKCHAPLGNIQAHLDGQSYSYVKMLADSLGLDGVSCSACHQQPAEGLGSGHSGNFIIDTNRIFFGQYANPFLGPMQIYVGFEPVFSDHIVKSGVCAGCHTLITETLHEDGTPSGHSFVEQATYHEWLNSSYPAQGKECQTCHMPFIKDPVVIATDFLSLFEREPYGLHQFFGANTAMLDLMKNNKELLDMPTIPSEQAWQESIANNRLSLSNAAAISMSPVTVLNDTLYFELSIKNKTGHKLPSGYPSRLAWLQIILIDGTTHDTLYSNGLMDAAGHIAGRDYPFEPHHQVSTSGADVQIYEMAMGDINGQLTTRLNAAYQPLKDNRILPVGFSRSAMVYDTVAIWGNANDDDDYNTGSSNGMDVIEYRIPLGGNEGIVNMDISLRYHSIPSRWMEDLFAHDTVQQVALFKNLYDGYETFDEVIDSIGLRDIDLSTTSTAPVISSQFISIAPNPATGHSIHVLFSDDLQRMEKLTYRIIDINGKMIQRGQLSEKIDLSPGITTGVYYLLVDSRQQTMAIKAFIVL